MASVIVLVMAGIIAVAVPAIVERSALRGGGQVAVEQDGDVVRVSVTGPRAGLASLCLSDGSTVRILHASAAVGEATYQKAGARWELRDTFDWQLRDSPRNGGATPQQREAFLAREGWVANASAAGSANREFRIRLREGVQYLGVTFLATADPMSVSYWPPAIADDCRLQSIAQGYLPDRAAFQPDTWYRLPAAP